jgi:hypothetical protein
MRVSELWRELEMSADHRPRSRDEGRASAYRQSSAAPQRCASTLLPGHERFPSQFYLRWTVRSGRQEKAPEMTRQSELCLVSSEGFPQSAS